MNDYVRASILQRAGDELSERAIDEEKDWRFVRDGSGCLMVVPRSKFIPDRFRNLLRKAIVVFRQIRNLFASFEARTDDLSANGLRDKGTPVLNPGVDTHNLRLTGFGWAIVDPHERVQSGRDVVLEVDALQVRSERLADDELPWSLNVDQQAMVFEENRIGVDS